MTALRSSACAPGLATVAPPPGTPRYVNVFRALLYWALVMAALWAGPVVTIAALAALVLALVADWDGGVRHSFRLGGLALAVWLAPTLGSGLGDLIARTVAVPPIIAAGAGPVVLALGIMALAGLLARRLTRRLKKWRHLCGLNHMFGATLGVSEGVLLVAAGCWLLVTIARPLEVLRTQFPPEDRSLSARVIRALADAQAAVYADPAGNWIAERNPLTQLSTVQGLELAADLLVDPARLWAALEDGQLDEFLALPEVRPYVVALEGEPALRAAVEHNDARAVLNHPLGRKALNDRALQRVALEHRAEIRAAVGPVDYNKAAKEARGLDSGTRRQLENLAKEHGARKP